ncbi:MAG: ABC transporter substrate-binding protein, partial [Acetomicrobium sp.]|nr:ABC transporter substrate-binding protein [Acetomicrobium sp.]
MKKVIFRTMLIGLFVGMIFTGYAWATVDDRIVRFTASNTPNIDPAQGHDRASQIALVNLYDSLIFQDYLGNLKKGVAESWTVSDDGLKYTFKIRDGILFHNGEKLTADDVVFSMKRLLTIKRGFSYLFEGLVKDISNPSNDTVVITLSEPFGPFLSTLTRFYIVNKKQVLEHL